MRWMLIWVSLALCGCATFYERNIEFQQKVAEGDFEKAGKVLNKSRALKREKNLILLHLNNGFLDHLQGNWASSNTHFQTADLRIEDYRRNLGAEALSFITNPEAKPYRAEDFESVLVHFYKALNYTQLYDLESARVEARRINLKLQQLNEKYPSHKNRYSDDAFGHLLMGLIYEAQGDVNNAFIAYRNAYNLFEKAENGVYLGVELPEQLKADLVRTARANGFDSEVEFYVRKFGKTYAEVPSPHGEAIVFWLNGLGPVKSEWSINFQVVRGAGGSVSFVNEEYGLSFPYLGAGADGENNGELDDLTFLRVAFPKYQERVSTYNKAIIRTGGESYVVEEAENINSIAFKTLEDRFFREMGNSLARLAVKRATEEALRDQSETAGVIASVANAITEKADTRNWQTLPHSIGYARIPLVAGENELQILVATPEGRSRSHTLKAQGTGQMVFIPFHSLDHQPVNTFTY